MFHKCNHILQKKSGETLVEVMVSMVVFLLILGMMQMAVTFAGSAIKKNQQIRADAATAEQELRQKTDYDAGDINHLVFKGYREGSQGGEFGKDVFSVDVCYSGKTVNFQGTDGEERSVTYPMFTSGGETP